MVQLKGNLTPSCRLLVGKTWLHPHNSQQTGTGTCRGSYLCQVHNLKHLSGHYNQEFILFILIQLLQRNYYSPLNCYQLLVFIPRFTYHATIINIESSSESNSIPEGIDYYQLRGKQYLMLSHMYIGEVTACT